MASLVEVKYFEPARGNPDLATLEGRNNYPDRYRYSICWLEEIKKGELVQIVGEEGKFLFQDGFCPRFLGEYPAIIVRRDVPMREKWRADEFRGYAHE